MELILSPCDITIPPNGRLTIQTYSQIYSEHNVTGIRDILPRYNKLIRRQYKSTHNQLLRSTVLCEKGLHRANFSVLTPEQLKNIQPVDPVTT